MIKNQTETAGYLLLKRGNFQMYTFVVLPPRAGLIFQMAGAAQTCSLSDLRCHGQMGWTEQKD